MRIYLLLGLLTFAVRVFAQEFPSPGQVRIWTGFPSGTQLNTRSLNPRDELSTSGTFIAGRCYESPKTNFRYSIKLYAPNSFLAGKREKLLALVKKIHELEPKSEAFADFGTHHTSNGDSFYVLPGGIGPGGGATFAIASTKQFDLVVEEFSFDADPHVYLHPTNSLSHVFEAIFAFFSKQTEESQRHKTLETDRVHGSG